MWTTEGREGWNGPTLKEETEDQGSWNRTDKEGLEERQCIPGKLMDRKNFKR